MILNARRLRSGHLQRKNYFKFVNRENLRIFPIDFFTGGVVKATGICSACFLRKRPRGREATSPSPFAHYVRIQLSLWGELAKPTGFD